MRQAALERVIILLIVLLILLIGVIRFWPGKANFNQSIILPNANWLKAGLIPESPFPLQAKAGIVLERKTGKIIYQRNPHQALPMASLTKLMTALVVDYNEELFYQMLLASDNRATEKLTKEDTVKKMNQKAQELGLKNTFFVDSTGLDPGNISTAYEMALLTEEVLKDKRLAKILGTKKYKNFENTNKLLDLPNVIAGKTGFTNEAGECLVLITDKLISVVLNAQGRFAESEKLIKLLEQ